MSKEELFENFEAQLRKYYNGEIVDTLVELLQKSLYCGCAGGYAESVNEFSTFVKNQVDTFDLEFNVQK